MIDRISLLRGTLAAIAEGRGPAPEMAQAALDRDDRDAEREHREAAPRPGFCECGRPLGHP